MFTTVHGVVSLTCQLRNTQGHPVSESMENKNVTDAIAVLTAVLIELRESLPNLRAAAISIPGIVTGGVISVCDIPELTGVDLAATVGALGLGVAVDNDMNFAAVGYARQRRPESPATLAFMVFPGDNCPGCGLIVNGALLRGMGNFAGEIAFLPGLNRDDALLVSGDDARFRRYVGTIVASVIAVINPEAVVLAGGAVTADMLDDIRDVCLETIPARHLPELEICPDYREYSLAGLSAAALESVDNRLRLTESERIWQP